MRTRFVDLTPGLQTEHYIVLQLIERELIFETNLVSPKNKNIILLLTPADTSGLLSLHNGATIQV